MLHAHFIKFPELMIRLVAPPFRVLLQVLIDLGSIFRQVGALANQTPRKDAGPGLQKDSVSRSVALEAPARGARATCRLSRRKCSYEGLHSIKGGARQKKWLLRERQARLASMWHDTSCTKASHKRSLQATGKVHKLHQLRILF